MHASKMILVPHDIGGRKDDGATNLISSLDREMNRILQDNTLAEDTKIILYNQILHRYRKTKEEHNKPFQLELHEPKMEEMDDTMIEEEATDDPVAKRILDIIPRKWQRNALALLDYVNNNPHMKWSDKGEMIVDDKKIANTNIIDLISDFSKDSRIRKPAIGAEIFMKNLLKENVPRELIVNKLRLNLANRDVQLASTPTLVKTWKKL